MRHLGRLGHSLAAGAVAGAALAPVQLLLWADIRLPLGKALLALAAWASWGAVWVGLLYFIVLELSALVPANLLGRNGFSLPLWRRLMAATSLLVAILAVWNRHGTRDLLVSANRQALSVVAWLAGLYGLVLLVLVLRRASQRLSPAFSLGASGLFVGVLWGIWVLTPPPPPPLPGNDAPTFKAARNLLFVSWEGADLPWLLPILERGDMPFLQSRRERGAWGQLRTVRPYTRSAALATLVTGCAPSVHGVLGKRSYRLPWLLDRSDDAAAGRPLARSPPDPLAGLGTRARRQPETRADLGDPRSLRASGRERRLAAMVDRRLGPAGRPWLRRPPASRS